MSETLIIALCTAGGALAGATLSALIELIKNRSSTRVSASDLLLDAQKQLAATTADAQLLWQWNRALIDHIYTGSPPPPPSPPENLFKPNN